MSSNDKSWRVTGYVSATPRCNGILLAAVKRRLQVSQIRCRDVVHFEELCEATQLDVDYRVHCGFAFHWPYFSDAEAQWQFNCCDVPTSLGVREGSNKRPEV